MKALEVYFITSDLHVPTVVDCVDHDQVHISNDSPTLPVCAEAAGLKCHCNRHRWQSKGREALRQEEEKVR